jgi:hypothetical protein
MKLWTILNDASGGGRQELQTITRSPKSGNRQMANIGKVKFQPPNVPVIFVLGLLFAISECFQWPFQSPGGPGSGKVTHCDTLMQEKRGVTHINMMDLLQQYAIGNGESQSSRSSKLQTLLSISDAWSIINRCRRTNKVDNRGKFLMWIIHQGQSCSTPRSICHPHGIISSSEFLWSYEIDCNYFLVVFRHAGLRTIAIENRHRSVDAWGEVWSAWVFLKRSSEHSRWKCRRRQKLISFRVIRDRCEMLLNTLRR